MNKFTDERGTIKDLLVTDDYSITHITFNEGAVRGNHYHEKTIQHDLVLKGKLMCKTDRGEDILTKGNDVTLGAFRPHAYKALEYSEIISICFGVRRGEDYEKDVIRLETSLL